MSEVSSTEGNEVTPIISNFLEPATSTSISHFQRWIGEDVLQYLKESGHEVYCRIGAQFQEQPPDSFYVRDRGRVIDFHIATKKPTNFYKWPFKKNTVVSPSFVFEGDYIKDQQGELTDYHEVNRKELKGDTLSFIRFAFETLRRIRNDTTVVLQVLVGDDARYDLYHRMLSRIGSPSNIQLTTENF